MNETDLQDITRLLSKATDAWKRVRVAALALDAEIKRDDVSEWVGWEDVGPTLLEPVNNLQTIFADTRALILLQRFKDHPTLSEVANVATNAWRELAAHVDEITDEVGKLGVANWVEKRSSQRGKDRELQLALDFALEDFSCVQPISQSSTSAPACDSESDYSSIEKRHRALLELLASMEATGSTLRDLVHDVQEHDTYRGGYTDAGWQGIRNSLDDAVKKIAQCPAESLRDLLANWKMEVAAGNGYAPWPFDVQSNLSDVHIPTEILPLVLCETALCKWHTFVETILIRHGIDSLEVYEQWDQDFDSSVRKVLNACGSALRELKGNRQFAAYLIESARQKLGLPSPVICNQDEPPVSDSSDAANLPPTLENFPSYDDLKMLLQNKRETGGIELN